MAVTIITKVYFNVLSVLMSSKKYKNIKKLRRDKAKSFNFDFILYCNVIYN